MIWRSDEDELSDKNKNKNKNSNNSGSGGKVSRSPPLRSSRDERGAGTLLRMATGDTGTGKQGYMNDSRKTHAFDDQHNMQGMNAHDYGHQSHHTVFNSSSNLVFDDVTTFEYMIKFSTNLPKTSEAFKPNKAGGKSPIGKILSPGRDASKLKAQVEEFLKYLDSCDVDYDIISDEPSLVSIVNSSNSNNTAVNNNNNEHRFNSHDSSNDESDSPSLPRQRSSDNMKNSGNELQSGNQIKTGTIFIKLSASLDALLRAAEKRGMRKRTLNGGKYEIFSMETKNEFINPDYESSSLKCEFFSPAERIMLVRDILANEFTSMVGQLVRTENAVNSSGNPPSAVKLFKKRAAKRLAESSNIMVKATPLHDEPCVSYLLRNIVWSKSRITYLPLDDIRAYFGEEIAFYFAFIGHYTRWLAAPVMFNFFLFYLLPYMISKDAQNSNYFSNTVLTIVYSLFIALWATNFLESWKRRQFQLAFSWNVHDHEDIENDRPEFRSIARMMYSETTKCSIYYVPWYRHFIGYVASFVLCMMSIVTAGGVMVIFLSLDGILSDVLNSSEWKLFPWKYAKRLPMILYSGFVMGFSVFSQRLAVFATTKLEIHRTESEVRNAVIIKLVALQFVNYYISLFYTAFVRQDIAMLQNCLATLLIVQQVSGQVMEVLFPVFTSIVNSAITTATQIMNDASQETEGRPPSIQSPIEKKSRLKAIKDFKENIKLVYKSKESEEVKQAMNEVNLEEYVGTFNDYLEIWVQFGLVTLFASVFPLAALLAFLNNILEIRSDAFKILRATRRALPVEVSGIGSWLEAFEFLGYVAVMTNSALIGVIILNLNRNSSNDTNGGSSNSNADGSQGIKYDSFTDIFQERYILISFLVLLEHLVIGFKMLISLAIPDIPEDIDFYLRNQKQQENSKKQKELEILENIRSEMVAASFAHRQSPILTKSTSSDGRSTKEEDKINHYHNLKQWGIQQYRSRLALEQELKGLQLQIALENQSKSTNKQLVADVPLSTVFKAVNYLLPVLALLAFGMSLYRYHSYLVLSVQYGATPSTMLETLVFPVVKLVYT